MNTMTQDIATMLMVGGKSNSLGKTDTVIGLVLADIRRLDELYVCMLHDDPWVRMRAADAFEKVCRQQPVWVEPYIDRMQADLSDDGQQPSIQWHLAQIYEQVALTSDQKRRAILWLGHVLSSRQIDWIVVANAMRSLAFFARRGDYPKDKLLGLLEIQLDHKSPAVVRKAGKLIADFS